MSNRWMSASTRRRYERGVAFPLLLVSVIAIIGIVGLAIDGAFLLARKAQLQNTADSAALACAIENQQGGSCVTGNNPSLFANINPYGFTLQATVPVSCPQPWQSRCVSADASATWGSFFVKLLGINTVSTSARGIAGRNNPCVLGLSTTGTNVTFNMGNNESTTMNCLLGSRSTAASSITNSGSGPVSTTVGIITKGNISGTISSPSTLTNSAAPLNDPYAGLPAPPTTPCSGNTTISTCTTVSPGCYSNLTLSPPVGCTLNLSPGLYVITTGPLTFDTGNNRNISGTDVNFYAMRTTGAAISITGNGTVTLTARQYGTYANMLFIAATRSISITGGAVRTLNGVIYAPNNSITVGLTGTNMTTTGNLVANTISVTSPLTVNDNSRIKLLQ